jgi:arabinofuranosyltransferase
VPPPIRRSPGWRWGLRLAIATVPILLGALYVRHELATQGRLGFPLDDPYIHLQFARNLASGHGWSFNPGEPVPGATSPLWVVLLAGAHLAGVPMEWAPIVLGLACAALAAVLALEVGIAVGLPPALAALAGLAVGANGRFTWGSVSGMEPCLAAALLMLLLRLALTENRSPGRTALLGAVAGLATQARPEMLVVALLVGVAETGRSLRSGGTGGPARRLLRVTPYFAALGLVMLPHIAFCLATAGRPFPNTYYSKTVIRLGLSPDVLAERRASYFTDAAVWLWRDDVVTAVTFGLGMALWWVRRRPGRAALIPIVPLVFWVSAWATVPFHYSLSRYTIPLIPCVALIAMSPFDLVLARLHTRSARWAAVALAGLAVLFAAGYRQFQYEGLFQANVDNILKMQVAMGEWVRRELPPGARVATNDIGAITWYGGHPCIDTEGLVSTDLITLMLARLGTPRFTRMDDALLDYLPTRHPAVVIVFPDWYPALVRAPWLERIHEIDYPNNTGGGNRLVAYRVIGTP